MRNGKWDNFGDPFSSVYYLYSYIMVTPSFQGKDVYFFLFRILSHPLALTLGVGTSSNKSQFGDSWNKDRQPTRK